jgi:hypothetical protein
MRVPIPGSTRNVLALIGAGIAAALLAIAEHQFTRYFPEDILMIYFFRWGKTICVFYDIFEFVAILVEKLAELFFGTSLRLAEGYISWRERLRQTWARRGSPTATPTSPEQTETGPSDQHRS